MTTFKIGDTVRASRAGTCCYFDGVEGKVRQVCENNVEILYSEGNSYWWEQSYVELVKDPEFDITADISRQYTRGGLKVLKIVDTGFDTEYPIMAQLARDEKILSYTVAGSSFLNGALDDYDLVTRPELKPNIVKYLVTYFVDGYSLSVKQRDTIEGARDDYVNPPDDHFVPILLEKITYDPNTKSVVKEKIDV